MKTRAIFFISLIISLSCSVCISANAIKLADSIVASTASTVAPAVQDWQVLVESLAGHPEVLTKSWRGLRRVLPVACFRSADSRDLSCAPMAGVERISADPGPNGIIDVVLKAPASCDQVYSLMSRHLGKGSLDGGDKCSAEWKLDRWVKRASANLSRGRKDPSLLYLQFAVEQGP